MTRACFLLLADTDTHDAMGRVALTRAQSSSRLAMRP